MANHLKSIVQENVVKIMAKMPDRDTPTKLSKKCYWPRGKRAGKKVSARTVGYLFESDADSPSPTIDMIEATLCHTLQFIACMSCNLLLEFHQPAEIADQAKGTSGPSL